MTSFELLVQTPPALNLCKQIQAVPSTNREQDKKGVFLFVWGFSSHLRIFHLYGDVTIAPEDLQKFDICSAFMAIEQWGFLCEPHLLWHGASVYNGDLQGPVTLTPIAERLAVSLPVLMI